MATSSRQSALFGVNDWSAIYKTFSQAEFRSYDYETLRKSFIDYLRQAYPETFNDYIESSEFIAILDVIAFMGQGLAFRNDLNTRENFIDTAERRDSVIKLANLVSYTPKRNFAAQGYIKIVSISTTQNLMDMNGVNLSNLPILWNDPANSNWLNQFNTVINAALINSQGIGRPGNSADLLGITTSEYSLSIPEETSPVVPFTSQVDGINMNFELVSVTSVNQDYMYELPPIPTNKFNMLYRNDKLGYGSPNTGYFFFFKQGSLQSYDFTLQQQIANQIIDINIEGINNSDTWLYQLASTDSDNIIWSYTDNIYASAFLQTEFNQRRIFSVTSRFNDQVSYIFGDGVFSLIPIGTFKAYVRAGNALTYVIDPTEMQGISVSIPYVNRFGKTDILTMTLELPSPVSNSLARESLAEIKQRAPTRYYTQNRMVNGEDYSNFPYTLYSSIIKSKAVNRSSIGVSKNLDLLDPTGKYSSTNSFASDGAVWLDEADGFLSLTITTSGSIISFLTNELRLTLSSNRAIQYYNENYSRYTIDALSGDGTVYWQMNSTNANSLTGYFYTNSNNSPLPIPIGTYSSFNMKYTTPGALIKFTAPPGYYFDKNNRLVSGIPAADDKISFWTNVLTVFGDGYNNGLGGFSNGTGPVILNGYVPSGAIISTVIPVFDSSLSSELVQEAVIRMELQQNFTLTFDNSLTIAEDRWSIGTFGDADWFVKFTGLGNNRYSVSYRSTIYSFGSVADTRFSFDKNKLIYDPYSGKIIQDFINILATNTQPNSNYPLAVPIQISVTGQRVEADGYANDFSIEVSSTDPNNRELIIDPSFFETVTGYQTNSANTGIYVFFELLEDAISLSRYQLVPTSNFSQYQTKTQIEVVKYEYQLGQLFYAYGENVFYTTVQDNTVTTISYSLVEQPQFLMKFGRQGLQFQYRHNSNNSSRIDPATTNIIDLYVVPQSYYTAYQNYIRDSTNSIPLPNKPTIDELNQQYGSLTDYKMLSDSIILNSVIFKPLFGPKAAEQLRGTIKVVKNSKSLNSDSEIRSAIITTMNTYFDINNWSFGDTFYFSELSAYLHSELGNMISSAVLVPNDPTKKFGDLYEIKSTPYEIFVNAITPDDILVISALTPAELQIK